MPDGPIAVLSLDSASLLAVAQMCPAKSHKPGGGEVQPTARIISTGSPVNNDTPADRLRVHRVRTLRSLGGALQLLRQRLRTSHTPHRTPEALVPHPRLAPRRPRLLLDRKEPRELRSRRALFALGRTWRDRRHTQGGCGWVACSWWCWVFDWWCCCCCFCVVVLWVVSIQVTFISIASMY